MILIIDAYNVLKQQLHNAFISEKQRTSFVELLMRYAACKAHDLVVVFDGGPGSYPTKRQKQRVTVVYSGAVESADDYIKNYLEHHRHEDILLVSSDAVLTACASELGIESIDASAFYAIVRQELTTVNKEGEQETQTGLVKTSRRSTPDLDALMAESSDAVPDKRDDKARERTRSARTMSKRERKMLKKIGKL